ncbi:hypothetical protein MKK58_06280 [Methylobacterium sp. J-078]|uniref:hypothetical protein n=1 Tax=Methylobacterium sp. J-078 TaxID=2836657 RepID=UPI001FBA88D9|nr:hypothetical protein [Methylobacterium sp. J-078]MCJ2044138.1 hypothetical protein [Methylobacterium sp. J-078]
MPPTVTVQTQGKSGSINLKTYLVRLQGRGLGERIRAEDHESAAKRFLSRVARRDLKSRKYTPIVRRDGVTDDGVNWWMGGLQRRAADGNGWITDDYLAQFTTREDLQGS